MNELPKHICLFKRSTSQHKMEVAHWTEEVCDISWWICGWYSPGWHTIPSDLPRPPFLFTVRFSILCELDLSLSDQSPPPILSGRSHFRSLDAADGFPPTEHSSHATLKPAFTPFCADEKWVSSLLSFFSNTIKVICRVIRSTAGAAWGAKKFYFLWSLAVKLKIWPDTEWTLGASLIHLNPRHYYVNEPNSPHLILTEIGCWFNCFARTLIQVKNAVHLTRRS